MLTKKSWSLLTSTPMNAPIEDPGKRVGQAGDERQRRWPPWVSNEPRLTKVAFVSLMSRTFSSLSKSASEVMAIRSFWALKSMPVMLPTC